jgi:hypothetical protein
MNPVYEQTRWLDFLLSLTLPIMEAAMLRKYKEIFYGLLFGVGAGVIDTVMHTQMADHSFWEELVRPQPAMVFYRVLFLLFGLALGCMLWQKNRRERDFRSLTEVVEKFHHDLSAPALLMHTRLQLLLTKEDLHLPREAEEAVRFVYERSLEIQALAKERVPRVSSS